jgi:hypothetical protein
LTLGGRKEVRNGSYLRRLITSMGADRRGDAARSPEQLRRELLGRYRCRSAWSS